MPPVEISEAEEIRVAHGNPIPSPGHAATLSPSHESGSGYVRIFNKKGEFMAIAVLENGWARPTVVLTSINSGRSEMLGCILEKETQS
jgi:hypothetical protein